MIKELTKDTINEVLKDCKTGVDGLLGLYEAVIPNWNKVTEVGHFPTMNKKTTNFVVDSLMNLEPHRKSSVGMLWVNNGFGQNEGLKDWRVEYDMDKIQYVE